MLTFLRRATALLAAASLAPVLAAQQVDWDRIAGSDGNDAHLDVAVSTSGATYVLGYGTGQPTLANPGGASTTLAANALRPEQSWVARYDSAGALEWAVSIHSNALLSFATSGLAASPDDGVVVAVRATGSTTLVRPNGTVLNPAGTPANTSGFVAKLAANGTLVWSSAATAAANITDVDVAADGRAVVVGTASGATPSIGGSLIASPFSLFAFACSLDGATGATQWSTGVIDTFYDNPCVGVAGDGSARMSTSFQLSATLDGLGPISAPAARTNATLLVSVSATGAVTAADFAVSAAGFAPAAILDLDVASDGRAIAAGTIQIFASSGAVFGSGGAATPLSTSNSIQVGYAAEYSASLTLTNARSFDSASGASSAYGAAAIDGGGARIAGTATQGATFGGLVVAPGVTSGAFAATVDSTFALTDALYLDQSSSFGYAVDDGGAQGSAFAGFLGGPGSYSDGTLTAPIALGQDGFVARFDAASPAAPELIGLANIARECDSQSATATINIAFSISSALPAGASVIGDDITHGNPLVITGPAGLDYGVAGLELPMGVTELRFRILDGLGSWFDEETIFVTVEDTTAPVIIANATATIECQGSTTTLTPGLLGVSATDNCDANPSLSFSPQAVSNIAAAQTVTITATDLSGNTATSSIDVFIIDSYPPAFTDVPTSIDRDTTAATANVTFTLAATDCSTPITFECVAYDPDDLAVPLFTVDAAGTSFPIGSYEVVCTATDARGNTSAPVSFPVEIADIAAPVLAIPSDQTVPNDPGLCTASVLVEVAAIDNSQQLSIEVRLGSATGPVIANDANYDFDVGTTTVFASATDGTGNTATGTFNVTVLDAEAPVLAPPVTTSLLTNSAGDPITVTAAALGLVAYDNCDASPTITFAPAVVPVGTTNVTATATDAAGNSADLAFAVTVTGGAVDVSVLWPFDATVDNRIRPPFPLVLRVRVLCNGVDRPDAVVTVDRIDVLGPNGTPIANEVPDDLASIHDNTNIFYRLSNGTYMYILSTRQWDRTSGVRHAIVLKVECPGNVDTYQTIVTRNR